MDMHGGWRDAVRQSVWDYLSLGTSELQQASVFLQTTTATRAPSLTHPRWNKKTVAAPAPPRTPPPRPTATGAKPSPTRAPTVRGVSRTCARFDTASESVSLEPAGGTAAAAAPVTRTLSHFLFVSFPSVFASVSKTREENEAATSWKCLFVCRQEHPFIRDLGESTKCQKRRFVLRGEELFRKQSHSGTNTCPHTRPLQGSVCGDGPFWLVPFSPCRTWRRRPRPVRRANWSPRLRTLRRVRYLGLISSPLSTPPKQRENGRLSLLPPLLPPSLPSLFPSRSPRHSSATEGEWILPLSPRASFHIATFFTNAKRSSETAGLQSPLRPGVAPDRPAPVTKSERWGSEDEVHPRHCSETGHFFKTQKLTKLQTD